MAEQQAVVSSAMRSRQFVSCRNSWFSINESSKECRQQAAMYTEVRGLATYPCWNGGEHTRVKRNDIKHYQIQKCLEVV